MKIMPIIVCCLLIMFDNIVTSSENNRKIETVFIHGLNCSPKKLHEYYLPHEIIKQPASAVKLQNGKKSPLGQGQDIEDVYRHLDPKKQYALYCHSRGVAAGINCMKKYNPKNISMMVLEAGPADMLNVVDEIQYTYGIFPFWTLAQKEWILRYNYPKHPKNSIPPIQAIPKIISEARTPA